MVFYFRGYQSFVDFARFLSIVYELLYTGCLKYNIIISSSCFLDIRIPYSRNFLRTINFAVFVDFTATSKINLQKSYYSVQMQ